MNDVDDIFKSSIDDYYENPSAKVWKGIENNLDKADAEKYVWKLRTPFRLMCCFLMMFAVYTLYNVSFDHANIIERKNGKKPGSSHFKRLFNNDQNLSFDNNVYQKNITNQHSLESQQNGSLIFSYNETKNGSFAKSHEGIQELHPVQMSRSIIPENYFINALLPIKKINAEDNSSSKNLTNAIHKGQKKLFILSPFFSPDIPGSSLYEEYDYDNENKSQICDGEKNTFSFTAGALLTYQLSKKVSLQTGLSFSALFSSLPPKILIAKSENGAVNFEFPSSYGLINLKNANLDHPQIGDSLKLPNNSLFRLNYFTIPFLFKYHLGSKGKCDFNGSVGAGINIITDADAEIRLPANANSNETKETTKEIRGLKNSNYSTMLGIEALYHFSNKTSLSFQPIIRYSITSLNKNVPIKNTPYTIGFMTTVNLPF